MTASPQTATLLPMTVPFSERLSETWLLERTYHAQLWSGKELSVPDLNTTHNTVIAADGQVHEYADSAGAVQGFQTLPPREVSSGSQVQTVFPQFCYYHEVTCPRGVYRIEFFGPRMDERGYQVKEAA